jgi:hypothetical protein
MGGWAVSLHCPFGIGQEVEAELGFIYQPLRQAASWTCIGPQDPLLILLQRCHSEFAVETLVIDLHNQDRESPLKLGQGHGRMLLGIIVSLGRRMRERAAG